MRIYALLETASEARTLALELQQLFAEQQDADVELRADRPRYNPVPGGPIVEAYMLWAASDVPHAEDGYVKAAYVARYTSGKIVAQNEEFNIHLGSHYGVTLSPAEFVAQVVKKLKLKKPKRRLKEGTDPARMLTLELQQVLAERDVDTELEALEHCYILHLPYDLRLAVYKSGGATLWHDHEYQEQVEVWRPPLDTKDIVSSTMYEIGLGRKYEVKGDEA